MLVMPHIFVAPKQPKKMDEQKKSLSARNKALKSAKKTAPLHTPVFVAQPWSAGISLFDSLLPIDRH